MSMENAILEHAAALNNLAESIRSAMSGGATIPVELEMTTTIDGKAAELAEATEKRAAAARELTAKDAQQNAAKGATKEHAAADNIAGEKARDAELEQAVGKIESTVAEKAQAELESYTLDYAKDVRPVLLAAIKKAGKDKVQALIATFGVDKADKVDPAKHGELLAGAQKLAA